MPRRRLYFTEEERRKARTEQARQRRTNANSSMTTTEEIQEDNCLRRSDRKRIQTRRTLEETTTSEEGLQECSNESSEIEIKVEKESEEEEEEIESEDESIGKFRGRKKYSTPEERRNARNEQQRQRRARKKGKHLPQNESTDVRIKEEKESEEDEDEEREKQGETETPEDRQRRWMLRRLEINRAARRLEMELEKEGIPQEEIEKKTLELKNRMYAEPLHLISPAEEMPTSTPPTPVLEGIEEREDNRQFIGRQKYATDEERRNARNEQQRQRRARKKEKRLLLLEESAKVKIKKEKESEEDEDEIEGQGKTESESPEDRQRRWMLRKHEINEAVKKLETELEQEGVPHEEIEKKALELKTRMYAEPLPLISSAVEMSTSTTTTTTPTMEGTECDDNRIFIGRRKYATDEERRLARNERDGRRRAKERELRLQSGTMTTVQVKSRPGTVRKWTPTTVEQTPPTTTPQGNEDSGNVTSTTKTLKPHPLRKYLTVEERRKANTDRIRRYRAAMDPEVRREKKRNEMYLWKHAKLASMTPEEKEEYYRKQREYGRKSRLNKTKEQKDKAYQRNYFNKQAKLAEMTKEEREEWRRDRREYAKKWRKNMTEEERKRYHQWMVDYQKKKQYGAYAPKSSEQYERILEWQRQRVARETPQERQKRLRKYKVNQAVRKLRKDLENLGVSQEEIEAKVGQLKERMWAEPYPPLENVSSYTPRQRKSRMKEEGETVDGSGCTSFPQFFRSYPSSSTYESMLDEPIPPPEAILNEIAGLPSHLQMTKTEVGDMTSTSNPTDPERSTSPQVQPAEDFSVEDCGGFDVDDYHDNYEHNYEEPEGPLIPTATPPPAEEEEIEYGASPSRSMATQTNIRCPHCTSHFPQRSDLTAHISSEHPKKCWKCPMCDQVMLSSLELEEHFKSEHGPKPKEVRPDSKKNDCTFSCIKCDPSVPDSEKAFRTLIDLNGHVKDKHPESYWPCPKCELLKYSERSLIVHVRICGRARLTGGTRKKVS